MSIFLSVIGMYYCGYYATVLPRKSSDRAKASLFLYIDARPKIIKIRRLEAEVFAVLIFVARQIDLYRKSMFFTFLLM